MACSCVGCLCVWPCVWWERSLCGLNGWLCAGSVWVFTHRASGVLYIYTLSIVGAPCCLCCVLRVCVCVCAHPPVLTYVKHIDSWTPSELLPHPHQPWGVHTDGLAVPGQGVHLVAWVALTLKVALVVDTDLAAGVGVLALVNVCGEGQRSELAGGVASA